MIRGCRIISTANNYHDCLVLVNIKFLRAHMHCIIKSIPLFKGLFGTEKSTIVKISKPYIKIGAGVRVHINLFEIVNLRLFLYKIMGIDINSNPLPLIHTLNDNTIKHIESCANMCFIILCYLLIICLTHMWCFTLLFDYHNFELCKDLMSIEYIYIQSEPIQGKYNALVRMIPNYFLSLDQLSQVGNDIQSWFIIDKCIGGHENLRYFWSFEIFMKALKFIPIQIFDLC